MFHFSLFLSWLMVCLDLAILPVVRRVGGPHQHHPEGRRLVEDHCHFVFLVCFHGFLPFFFGLFVTKCRMKAIGLSPLIQHLATVFKEQTDLL